MDMDFSGFMGVTLLYIILFFAVCLILVAIVVGGYYVWAGEYKDEYSDEEVYDKLEECFGDNWTIASSDEQKWCLEQ